MNSFFCYMLVSVFSLSLSLGFTLSEVGGLFVEGVSTSLSLTDRESSVAVFSPSKKLKTVCRDCD